MGLGDDGTYLGIFGSSTGSDFRAGILISNNPDALAIGEVYYISHSPTPGLVITQVAAANETEASAQDALRGRLGGVGAVTLYLSVHTADPGTTGASESGLDRIPFTSTDFAYSDT